MFGAILKCFKKTRVLEIITSKKKKEKKLSLVFMLTNL